MPRERQPFEVLKQYIPEGSFEPLMQYIEHYKIKLTVTRKRLSILGDYRHAHGKMGHRISINGNLNSYAFLITLLHEIAHLLTFEQYGNTVKSHGKEWKNAYAGILVEFIALNILPELIRVTLLQSIKNPAASSCSDDKLLRVLRQYDQTPEQHVLVEQVPIGKQFSIPKNRVFEMGEKIRKRYKCRELATGKWYLFSGVYEVQLVGQVDGV